MVNVSICFVVAGFLLNFKDGNHIQYSGIIIPRYHFIAAGIHESFFEIGRAHV